MRTTLQIDDDVLAEARQMALAQGRSVGAVISDLARHGLRPIEIRFDGRFPVFDVPHDAPTITSEHVAAALDDE